MKIKSVYILLSVFFVAAGCSAQSKKIPDMIMLTHEGMPRAHIPTIIWFAGKTLPAIASNEEHDGFWKARYDAAPKFSLGIEEYLKLKSLLGDASKDEGAYVLELLYSDRKSEVLYFNTKKFNLLQKAIKDARIKGHEVLADWPDQRKGSIRVMLIDASAHTLVLTQGNFKGTGGK
jgi:hypothetical protein